MGQSASTLNSNLPNSHLTEKSASDKPKFTIYNQENFNPLASRIENPQATSFPSSMTSRKLPIQTKSSLNENKRSQDQILLSTMGEHRNGTKMSIVNKESLDSKFGPSQPKRRNSEDFDMSMMEENVNLTKQSTNIPDHSDMVDSSLASKEESLFKPESRNQLSSNTSFNTNKSLQNSQSQFNIQKSQTQSIKLAQRGVLTIKELNVPNTVREVNGEYDSVNLRKHTFGKENSHSDTNNYITSHYLETENKPYQLDDEVRIMDTGHSSTRKLESERDFFYQSNATTQLLHDELMKTASRDQKPDLTKTNTTPASSTRSVSQQPPARNLSKRGSVASREHESIIRKDSIGDDKKTLYSLLIEESENPSPIPIKKQPQTSHRGSKGFPDVEFSFKPNMMSKERARFNTEEPSIKTSSSLKAIQTQRQKSLGNSKSGSRKKSLPPVETLNSESSSCEEGHVSVESTSSISSYKKGQSHGKKSKLRHNSTKRQSRGHDCSNHFLEHSCTQGPVAFSHQSFHPVPHTPMMNNVSSMSRVPSMPVMSPMDSYPYNVNQSGYHSNPTFPHMNTPMNNHFPYYYPSYQVRPSINTGSVGMYQHPNHFNSPAHFYSSAQPSLSGPYGHDFTSPPSYSNLQSRISNNLFTKARNTSSNKYTPLHNRAGTEAGPNCSQYTEEEISGHRHATPLHQTKFDRDIPKTLRTSKSLKSLKYTSQPTRNAGKDIRTEKLSSQIKPRLESSTYKTQNLMNVRPSSYMDSFSRDAQINTEMEARGVNRSNLYSSNHNENNTSNYERRTLNETNISRINEVPRKRPAYQEESEGVNDLDNTEYSLVQKLEGNSRETVHTKNHSMINSPTNKEEKDLDVRSTMNRKVTRGTEKDESIDRPLSGNTKQSNVLVFRNEKTTDSNGKRTSKWNNIEILAETNSESLRQDFQDLATTQTPSLPVLKDGNKILTFDFQKNKSDPSGRRILQDEKPQIAALKNKKPVKLCFDFGDDSGIYKKEETQDNKEDEKSIAEYFKQRRHSMFQKLEEENKRFSTGHNLTKEVGREDLVQIRKELRTRFSKKSQVNDRSISPLYTRELNQTPDISNIRILGLPSSPMEAGRQTSMTMISNYSSNAVSNVSRKNAKETNTSILERLALGQKHKISKKDMVSLTAKNYEKLPEVRRKRDEKKRKEEMKEDLKKRQEKVRDLDARLRRPRASKSGAGESKSLYL